MHSLDRSALSKENVRACVLFFLLLAVGEFVLYFSNPGHYFQQDTLFWFTKRMHSFSEFFWSFFELDPAAWYRPLTNRTVQSVLYPLVGMRPTVYHLILFPIFFCNSAAVFYLTYQLTRRLLAAGLATVFFSVNTVNAYVTYDVAFFTELVYPFFYITGAIAALHYIQTGRKSAWWVSLGCYLLALFSKESAVTLPATIIVLCWFEGDLQAGWRQRVRQALSVAGPHLVLMTIYMVFVLGYLRVGGHALDDVLTNPDPQDPNYRVTLSSAMLINLDFAFTWAFNLPRGWHTQWRGLDPWMDTFLRVFRAAMVILMAALLFGRRRKTLYIGLAWFVIALSPMLTLINHFIPYYMYMPLMGLSVVIGTAVDAAFQAAARWPRLRVGTLVVPFVLLGIVCVHSIRKDIVVHPLMGGAAIPGLRNVQEMKRIRPELAPGTLLFFLDAKSPGFYFGASAPLFQLAYNDDTLNVGFASSGDHLSIDQLQSGKLLAFETDADFNIVDVTEFMKAHPETLDDFSEDPNHALTVSPRTVEAGRDSYVITVANTSNQRIDFFYTLDGVRGSFGAKLDIHGEVRFEVGADTRRGEYHFTGFQLMPEKKAIKADAWLTVK